MSPGQTTIMNRTNSLCRCRLRFALLISSLGLIALIVLGDETEQGSAEVPEVKGDPRGAEKMVDAIENRNLTPKLVDRFGSPKRVALYPDSYDWTEDERVLDALDRLYQTRTAELWEEMVRRQ